MSDTSRAGGIPEWTLGWRMKRALAYGGMTAEQMAEELGVVPRTVSRWVAEGRPPPRPVYLKQWALKCGVPYGWLVGQEPNSASDLGVPSSRCRTPSPTWDTLDEAA